MLNYFVGARGAPPGTPLGVMALLSDTNAHPRDSRIEFQEEGHKYFIDGSRGGYVSTTTLIHSLFSKFDADRVIEKMKASVRWPNSKYFGMTDGEIKSMWDKNRDEAAAAGTAMHLNLERYYNGLPHDTSTREFAMFDSFRRDFPGLKPHRTEWVIFDEDARVCGSIDMIFTNDRGEYVMCDFKRSKEIKHRNRWQSGSHEATAPLDDCNFVHYSLQMGIYKYMLEKNYGITISETFLLVLHPNQEGYLKVATSDVSSEVARIMSFCRRRIGQK